MEQPANEAAVSPAETFKLIVKQMRPKQWAKNFIVYTPLLFAGRLSDPIGVIAATGAFVAFCLVSSGIYILNDVTDVEADRAHPTKKNRPLASGRLNIKLAKSLVVVCLAGGMSCAFLVRPSLTIVCLAYITINVLYSFRLKHIPIIDTFCIASGFVIRAVAGALAVKVAPSSWFLLCTTLGSLWLGLEKRRQELKLLDATSHRKVLSDYSVSLLDRMESVIVPSLLTSYAFYSFQSPHGQWMMLTVPIVMYGMMRYQMLSEQGTSTGAPEDVFWHDRPIQLTIVLWLLTCAFVIYGSPGYWVDYYGGILDSLRGGH